MGNSESCMAESHGLQDPQHPRGIPAPQPKPWTTQLGLIQPTAPQANTDLALVWDPGTASPH